MYKVCPICRCGTPLGEPERHTLGCPVIWEEISRKAGNWRNALLAQVLVDRAQWLNDQKAHANRRS